MVEKKKDEIDLHSTVNLVFEFLKDNNLVKTIEALAQETGVPYCKI
jgi:hypothetical protein